MYAKRFDFGFNYRLHNALILISCMWISLILIWLPSAFITICIHSIIFQKNIALLNVFQNTFLCWMHVKRFDFGFDYHLHNALILIWLPSAFVAFCIITLFIKKHSSVEWMWKGLIFDLITVCWIHVKKQYMWKSLILIWLPSAFIGFW